MVHRSHEAKKVLYQFLIITDSEALNNSQADFPLQ